MIPLARSWQMNETVCLMLFSQNRWHDVTFPRLASLLVSLKLMCLSMLVSPLDMRTACQMVRPPRATPTVLR